MRFPVSSRPSAFSMNGATRAFRPAAPQTIFPFQRSRSGVVGTGMGGRYGSYRGGSLQSPYMRPPAATPGGSYGSYGRWLRHAKWFGRFLAAAALAEELYEAYQTYQHLGDLPPDFTGWVLPPGWKFVCTLGNNNTMPRYPTGSIGNVCGASSGAFPGQQWYQAPPAGTLGYLTDPCPRFGTNGLDTGYWVGMLCQQRPGPTNSPQVYHIHEEFFLRQAVAAPVPAYLPHVSIIPDDRWPSDMQPQLTPVVPGASGTPLPLHVAQAAGAWGRPVPSRAPGPASGPGVRPAPGPWPPPGPVLPPAPPAGGGFGDYAGSPSLDRPPPHWRYRPSRKDRERKWRAKGPLAAAISAVSWATEANDFVNAMWWAMSKKSRHAAFVANGYKPLNPLEKAAWVAAHPGDVDWAKGLTNLAHNAGTDRAAGIGGGHTRDWHRANHARGWDSRGRGPFETFNRLQAAGGLGG